MKYWILVLLGLSFFGCDKDSNEGMDLDVFFRLTYNDAPVVMFKDYRYPDGKKMQFTRFSFFLSELTVAGLGIDEQLESISYIDLTKQHLDSNTALEPVLQLHSSMGAVNNLSFNIGLTPEQNTTIPADHPTGHPLAQPGEYWLAWDSYVFVKMEGWIDLNGDDEAETAFALHLGSDQVMRELEFGRMNGQDRDFVLDIDVRSFFGTTSLYDIEANPQIHSLSQLPDSEELADNLQVSFTIGSL